MLRDVLAAARVYSLFGRLVGATQARRRYVERHIRPKPGDRILDIGCGPADILEALHDVEYHGLDQSADYIDSARARYGTRGQFEVETVGVGSTRQYKDFDIVLATGVLHHLSDEDALALLRMAKTALTPIGTLVTLDGTLMKGQSAPARFLARIDRGMFVRPPDEYLRLAARVFPHVDVHVSHDLLRIPYTHVIMRCGNGVEATTEAPR
jgi:cyclopropane fatty-acyl-phospholipid synthase-like methyltransferase